jgi:hypothetical protein
MRRADFDAIAVLQKSLLSVFVIDKGAVETLKVGEVHLITLIPYGTMTTRHKGVIDRHVVCEISANDRLHIEERYGRSLERTSDRDEFRFHRKAYPTRKHTKITGNVAT